MRHLAPGVGSPADQVNDITATLHECQDLRAVEYVHARIVRRLEAVRVRVDSVARRGGSSPGVLGPLRWLDQVVRDQAALDEPGGAALRDELRALVARIRERA
jgi:hypothetical protein